jgi:hypothetical protein
MAAGARQTVATALSMMGRKTFTAFLLGLSFSMFPRFPPVLGCVVGVSDLDPIPVDASIAPTARIQLTFFQDRCEV